MSKDDLRECDLSERRSCSSGVKRVRGPEGRHEMIPSEAEHEHDQRQCH